MNYDLEIVERTSSQVILKSIDKFSRYKFIRAFVFAFITFLAFITSVYSMMNEDFLFQYSCIPFFAIVVFLLITVHHFLENVEYTWIFDRHSETLTIQKNYSFKPSTRKIHFKDIEKVEVKEKLLDHPQKKSDETNPEKYNVIIVIKGHKSTLTGNYNYYKSSKIVEYLYEIMSNKESETNDLQQA
jgi:hypothetical protein